MIHPLLAGREWIHHRHLAEKSNLGSLLRRWTHDERVLLVLGGLALVAAFVVIVLLAGTLSPGGHPISSPFYPYTP
jgi:hypothetical protein